MHAVGGGRIEVNRFPPASCYWGRAVATSENQDGWAMQGDNSLSAQPPLFHMDPTPLIVHLTITQLGLQEEVDSGLGSLRVSFACASTNKCLITLGLSLTLGTTRG